MNPNEISKGQMVELLLKIRAEIELPVKLSGRPDSLGAVGYLYDIAIIDATLAALEEKSPNENLIKAVKDYLDWGPMTGSDRDLHESRFREALAALGVEVCDE